MKNPFKKLCDWNRARIGRNYQQVISGYSPEEQRLIEQGRNILITSLIKEDFSRRTGETLADVLRNQTPTRTGFMSYECLFPLGGKDYQGDVQRWLDLGKTGADVLLESHYLGPDAFQILIGKPAIIVGQRVKRKTLPLGAHARDIDYRLWRQSFMSWPLEKIQAFLDCGRSRCRTGILARLHYYLLEKFDPAIMACRDELKDREEKGLGLEGLAERCKVYEAAEVKNK